MFVFVGKSFWKLSLLTPALSQAKRVEKLTVASRCGAAPRVKVNTPRELVVSFVSRHVIGSGALGLKTGSVGRGQSGLAERPLSLERCAIGLRILG